MLLKILYMGFIISRFGYIYSNHMLQINIQYFYKVILRFYIQSEMKYKSKYS